jgi:signal peptidase II
VAVVRTAGRRAGWKLNAAVWLYAVAALVYVADRVTKAIVEDALGPHHAPVDLVPGVLRITYTENPGGAFGLFGSAPWLFLLATVLVCLVIVGASLTLSSRMLAVGLGLVLGGALGNLTDRIIRAGGLSGQVVDFIDFRVWPVFNVADAAIVIGAAVVVLAGIRRATTT